MKLAHDRTDGRDEAADRGTVDWLRAAADEVRATVPHGLVPAALAAAPAARRRRRLATVVPVTATAFTVAVVVTGTVLLAGGGRPAGPVPMTAASRPLVVTTAGGGTPAPGAPSPGTTPASGPVTVETSVGPAGGSPAGPSAPASGVVSPPRATPKPTLAAVTVPDVVGQTSGAARATLQAAGFTTGVSQTAICAAADVPVGVVTAQRPAAGSQADRQATISLQVAGECVAVPNVVGSPADTATTVLKNAGFQITYDGAWNCDYGYNSVTSQSPAGGTRLTKGSYVMISFTCATPLSTTPRPS